MEQNGQRSKGHTERRILVSPYATGPWPRFATLVRGRSRRITIMKASVSSILEYQSDQPSMKLLRPLSLLLQPQPRTNGPPFTFLLWGRSISGRGSVAVDAVAVSGFPAPVRARGFRSL